MPLKNETKPNQTESERERERERERESDGLNDRCMHKHACVGVGV